MNNRAETVKAFERVLDILDELRVKCPWDAKQTNESLRANTIEEVYELSDALLKNDTKEVEKELGDVLLHILFYSKIGQENGQFDIADVCNRLSDKLVFRHPHVFGTTSVDGSSEVEQNWEELKLKEKGGNKRVLDGVPASLPALIKAYRIQDKARNVGFDWDERRDVWAKVQEEFTELSEEVEQMDQVKMEEEFGDLFFSLINASRLYGINPDNALEMTNRKFMFRFNYIEQKCLEMDKSLRDMTLAEMDELWNEAKALQRKMNQ